MNSVTKAKEIWQQYIDGVRYQQSMGFTTDFPKFISFKEGDQWAAVTENTKNLPRPVFNITEMFIRAKRAAITNQGLSLVYSPLEVFDDEQMQERAEQGAKDFTDFAKIMWENLDQEELNNEFVDDSVTVGTGILHYYWNPNRSGGNQLKWQGNLEGEVLDPLNVFFANPHRHKIQEQEWVIIQDRMTVKSVRDMAKQEGIAEELVRLIGADNNESGEYTAETKEVTENDKITVLIKYFKKDGAVYYSKSIASMMLVEERPLTPEVEGMTYKMGLYPIAIMPCIRRKKCIYGLGIAQDIIAINKAINQLKAMQLLNAIQCGNPALITRPNAIRQKITNQGGQIITDYSPNGDGIRYMQPPNFSTIFSQLGNEMFELARTTTGVTDVSTGETLGANMAASAIIALQNQAKTPIKELQNRYFSAIKEVGDIWLEFFKAYYNTDRNMIVEDEEGNAENRIFNGSNYADIDYKLKVEVAVASDKETLAVSLLDAMRERQDINKEQYVELMPDGAMPFKADIKEIWKKEKQDVLVQAMGQIKQQQMIIEQLESQQGNAQKSNELLGQALGQIKQQEELMGGMGNEMQGM
jgi:nicotinic acid mononucleotide adenylyltransferase